MMPLSSCIGYVECGMYTTKATEIGGLNPILCEFKLLCTEKLAFDSFDFFI